MTRYPATMDDRLRTATAAIAALLLLVAAGCLGGTTTDDPGNTTAPDETPEYPPGVNASGIQDVDALYGAHFGVLRNATYRTNTTDRSVTENVTRGATIVQRVRPNGDLYAVSRFTNGSERQVVELWDVRATPEAYQLERTARGGARVTQVVRGPARSLRRNHSDQMRQLLGSFVAGADQNVTREGDDWSITVTARGNRSRFTLLATTDGFLRLQQLRDRTGFASTTLSVRTTLIDGFDEPDWVERARARSPDYGDGAGNGTGGDGGGENGSTAGDAGDASA